MAKRTVYLETSVIGYATSRPTRDLIVAAHQEITREWFSAGSHRYDLFVSQLVLQESSSGDREAAQLRIDFLKPFPLLEANEEVASLAATLIGGGAIPRKATGDALHIATASVHGVDFLLTWNCKHIANAAMRQAIENICQDAGFEPPVICTPEELMYDDQE